MRGVFVHLDLRSEQFQVSLKDLYQPFKLVHEERWTTKRGK